MNNDRRPVREMFRALYAVMISFAKMNENIINRLSDNCKVIVRCGMGVKNVDLPAAGRGIMVAKVQKYCTEEVSDHAPALMLTPIRKTAYFSRRLREGVWDPFVDAVCNMKTEDQAIFVGKADTIIITP